jgi:hypothetical protein
MNRRDLLADVSNGMLRPMKALRLRSLIVIVALLLTGGIVANALEVEGPNCQGETHHCEVCCTNYQTATPVQGQRLGPITAPASQSVIEPKLLVSQTVIRRLIPPPKFLA